MPTAIKFGTDGWRGIIADDFTFKNVRRLSHAIARVMLEDSPEPKLVIGYDTRFLSREFAHEVAQINQSLGIKTMLSDRPTPTPVISYAIQHQQANGGVVITASHNPPKYNGFKLKSPHGGSISKDMANRIEQALDESTAKAVHSVDVETFNPLEAYRVHILERVDVDQIRQANLKIVADAMYGAGRGLFPYILGDVIEIRQELNPYFGGIQPEPIERNLGELVRAVEVELADVGLATDGDADRIGAVDGNGRFVDPHHIFAILLNYLFTERGEQGEIVRSISTTKMIDRIAMKHGLQIHETPVGMSHITRLILERDVLMGGEESGGLALRGHIPEGDGILMGLLLLNVMAAREMPLSELVDEIQSEYGPTYYQREDSELSEPINKQKFVDRLMQNPSTQIGGSHIESISTLDGVKFNMRDGSWLLLRPSGTEPVLRIYAEAPTMNQVQVLIKAGMHMGKL